VSVLHAILTSSISTRRCCASWCPGSPHALRARGSFVNSYPLTFEINPKVWEAVCRTLPELNAIRPDPDDPARANWYRNLVNLGPEERRRVYWALFDKVDQLRGEDKPPVWQEDEVKQLFRDWTREGTGDFYFEMMIEQAADIHRLIVPAQIRWTHPALGPLSWLVLCEVIAFFVSFFQLPEWPVAAASFGILVGLLIVVLIITVALVPYPRALDFLTLGNLDPAWMGLPLVLYLACLVRVVIGLRQGRASFLTRVASYLAVSLVPGLLWVAAAFRTQNVTYPFRYLPSEICYLRCAVVFVLVPALSFIPQYLANRVNSLPE
jgi:hypothetical protein